jgi:ribosomal protein S18 acetylase RimI-like enzyme
MTAPEIVGQKQTYELKTALPDVTLKDIDVETLPKFKHMIESNAEFIAMGGVIPDAVYDMTENEVLGNNPNAHKRMGIWKNNQLVGYLAIVPSENPKDPNEVEVSYIVDPTYARQGIARAAVEAATEMENDKGNSVIAEVERYNHASIRLLGKLGYERSGYSDGREVYAHRAMTEEEMMRRLFS